MKTKFSAKHFSAAMLTVVACVASGAARSQSHAPDPMRERLYAPVKAMANQQLRIETPEGTGEFRVYSDHDIHRTAPEVTRVIVVIHGTLRNADAYFATGEQIVRKAGELGKGTLVVAPQFLMQSDVKAFSLPTETVAWTEEGWKGGEPAIEPYPISSFSALDALLKHFSNRRMYPALSTILVIGHSAGAQLVQRYAVVGREGDELVRSGIAVRYVVANPSSYLYFDDRRPDAPPSTLASCPSAIRWKYGLMSAPPYVAAQGKDDVEKRYAVRDVVYLLGQADTNPYTHFIDRSCAAMAQGPYRLARGLTYFEYLKERHPTDLAHTVVEVPGVGHDNLGMFTSDCGIAVLFGKEVPHGCPVLAAGTR